MQDWYIPPVLDEDQSNITNSENTTLFLVSCYQYVFAGIVLSVGPPYRQRMRENRKRLLSSFFATLVLILRFLSSPVRPHSDSNVTLRDLSTCEPSWLAFQLDATHRDVDQFQTFHSRRGSGRVSHIIIFGTVRAAAARQGDWKDEIGFEARQ